MDCTIEVGDCLKLIPTWKPPRFIFCDPPFNIGQNYNDFIDKKADAEFWAFNQAWLSACWEQLDAGGVFAVHVPDEMVDDVILWQHADGLRREQRINWVILHYRFGVCGRSKFIRSKCHCLIYRKDGQPKRWNPDDILVPSDRASKYKDKRTADYDRGGMRVPLDVFGIPSDGPGWSRVSGTNAERRPRQPNQLPELYLGRLIKAYTDPGDLVADPFCGSGTTATVATTLGRRFIGCDLSPINVEDSLDRVAKGAVRFEPLTLAASGEQPCDQIVAGDIASI